MDAGVNSDVVPLILAHGQVEYRCDASLRFYPLEELFSVDDMLVASVVALQEVTEFVCPVSMRRFQPHQLVEAVSTSCGGCPRCRSVLGAVPQLGRYVLYCNVCEWSSSGSSMLNASSPAELEQQQVQLHKELPCSVLPLRDTTASTHGTWQDVFAQLQSSSVHMETPALLKWYTVPTLPSSTSIDASPYILTESTTSVVNLTIHENSLISLSSFSPEQLPSNVTISPQPVTAVPHKISLIPSVRLRMPTTKAFLAQIDVHGPSTNATTSVPSLYVHATRDMLTQRVTHFLQCSIVAPFSVRIRLEVVQLKDVLGDSTKQDTFRAQLSPKNSVDLFTMSKNEKMIVEQGIHPDAVQFAWSTECVVYPEPPFPEFDVTAAHAQNQLTMNQNVTSDDIHQMYSTKQGKQTIDDLIYLLEYGVYPLPADVLQDTVLMDVLLRIFAGQCNVSAASTTIRLPDAAVGTIFFKLSSVAESAQEVEDANARMGTQYSTQYSTEPKVVYCMARLD